MEHKGRCLGGATKIVAQADPQFAIRCFCRDCQHVSGGGSAPQIGFAAEAVQVDGPIRTYHRKADSGSELTFVFCGDCGAPLTKATARAPALVFVYAAVMDDPAIVPDLKPVFEDSRAAWDR